MQIFPSANSIGYVVLTLIKLLRHREVDRILRLEGPKKILEARLPLNFGEKNFEARLFSPEF